MMVDMVFYGGCGRSVGRYIVYDYNLFYYRETINRRG
jgi:hypothetical protein